MLRRYDLIAVVVTAIPFFMSSPSEAVATVAPITVTASSLEDEDRSPGTVTVIRPDMYRGEMKDISDLLSKVPGVSINRRGGRGGYSVASVRGSTAAQVAVYIDGVLCNLGGDSAVDLSTIPVDRVDRIEVYRGYVPAAFDMSGMGAVINIVTARPERGEGSVVLGGGDLGFKTGSLRFGTALGDGTLSLLLGYESEDGDFSYLNDNGSLVQTDDYETKRWNNGFRDQNGTVRWDDGSWSLAASFAVIHKDLPLPAPGNDRWLPGEPGPWQDIDRRSFSLGREYSGGVWDWDWSLYRMEEDKTFSDPSDKLGGLGVRHSSYDTVRNGIDLSGTTIAGDHLLQMTLKADNEKLDVGGDGVKLLDEISHFERDSYAIVLQDTFTVGEVVLTPLLRWNDVDGEDGLSWSMGAEWAWSSSWRFKTTVGYSMRAPNFYEKYGDGASIVPNESLKWEEGYHWDMGVRWNGALGGADSSLGVTVFGMDMDELIEYIQVNERRGAYKNVGKAMIYGLEFEGDLDWNSWNLSMAWTVLDGENRTAGYRYGMALPNRPENALDLRLTNHIDEKLSAYVEMDYRGKTFLDMAEKVGLSELTRWNLGLRWDMDDDRTLVVGVDDIFDEGTEVRQFASGSSGGERLPWYPLEGRNWHCSLVWTF
ncbi:MAG: TonB-dependent receptor [Synergistota bacterium]|nr:TonB-dependent receptor [Synergistota bacterium]